MAMNQIQLNLPPLMASGEDEGANAALNAAIGAMMRGGDDIPTIEVDGDDDDDIAAALRGALGQMDQVGAARELAAVAGELADAAFGGGGGARPAGPSADGARGLAAALERNDGAEQLENLVGDLLRVLKTPGGREDFERLAGEQDALSSEPQAAE